MKIFGKATKGKGIMMFSEMQLHQFFILMLFILCDIFSVFKSKRDCQKPALQAEPGARNQAPHLHNQSWVGNSFLIL